jgi:hypothetical protein
MFMRDVGLWWGCWGMWFWISRRTIYESVDLLELTRQVGNFLVSLDKCLVGYFKFLISAQSPDFLFIITVFLE